MKNNYKMIIAYDGTRYYGWEHQPNTDMTIQGKLESVLSQMTGEQAMKLVCISMIIPIHWMITGWPKFAISKMQ